MTQTFMEPTIDIPAEVADPTECTTGHAWCNGDCRIGDEPSDPEDWDSAGYHSGTVALLPVLRFTRAGWQEQRAVLSVRHDENEGDATQPLIMVQFDVPESTPAMTAEQARMNAAWLLNAADMLDPLPIGVVVTTAVKLRIGDEVLTEHGWLEVDGVFRDFHDDSQVIIATRGRYADIPFGVDDAVRVRRQVHGSCAIQFVEPIPAGGVR